MILETFYAKLLRPLIKYAEGKISLDGVRNSLNIINQYFFNSYSGIGETNKGDRVPYFSEFHKLWETKAEEIIGPSIDIQNCNKIADILHQLKSKHGDDLFKKQIDLQGVSLDELAQIRFFTANQDFRGSRNTEEIIGIYRRDPSIFDIQVIASNPSNFLRNLGITQLSQTDKREKFIEKTIEFLKEYDVEPADIPSCFENDVVKIRQSLINNIGMGYGNKKTDMLIRDMYETKAWKSLNNIDKIDVASDINTIKVALRTGILKTKLSPLISSFLDIFCHQYSLMAEWAAKAYRKIWEIWVETHPESAPYGPAYLDFFLYSLIGKKFCKETLYQYEGKTCGHYFFWKTGQVSKCLICKDILRNSKVKFIEENNKLFIQCLRDSTHKYEVKTRSGKRCKICIEMELSAVRKVGKYLPCMKKEGSICFEGKEGLFGLQICPFYKVCKPTEESFKKLNPPKSISIYGQTGWESARTDIKEGGGGLMA